MGRPRRDAHAVPTNERILLAAEVAFAREGYRGARLEDIAAAAGIRRPSLLYHFKTKERLYAAVTHRLFEALLARFARVMAEPGAFDDKLMELMGAFVAFLDERPSFSPIVLRDVIGGEGPTRRILLEELVPLLDHIEGWMARAGAGRLPEGVPVRAALLQIGSNAMVRASAGPLRTALWGDEDTTLVLAKRLLFSG